MRDRHDHVERGETETRAKMREKERGKRAKRDKKTLFIVDWVTW